MHTFGKLTLGCVAAAIMFASADRVIADTLTVTNSGEIITVGLSDSHVPINGFFAGGMYLGSFDGGKNVDIYCVDVAHDIGWGAKYTVTAGFLNSLSTLYGPHLPSPTAQMNLGAVMYVANMIDSPATTPDGFAAIQIALWNAEYNGFALNTYSGPVTSPVTPPLTITTPNEVTPNTIALNDAQAILTAASNLSITDVLYGMNHTELFTSVLGGYDAYSGTGQSMVTWIPGGGGHQTVPEPSSFALLSLGGLGLALNAIRRRRLAPAA